MGVTETAPGAVGELAGYDLGARTVAYGRTEAILYALAVGAKAGELELVYEDRLETLPTLAWPLSVWAVEEAGRIGVYDPLSALHVGQDLRVHKQLPPAAEIEMSACIGGVFDKGSAALIEVVVSSQLFDTTAMIFIPGAGGFGGERGTKSNASPPERDPDLSLAIPTSPEQAALYRLTGDRHPLHIDPAVAARSGFDRPILHGLATLGSVTLGVARAIDVAPAALTEAAGRLVAPVYPGQELAAEVWQERNETFFEAAVGGAKVIKSGRAAVAATDTTRQGQIA